MRVATLCVGALLLGVLLAAIPASAEEARFGRLTADQRELAELKGTRTDIALGVMLDHPTATYRIGDALALSVTASDDVYLTILDVGASGNVTLLIPNEAQPDNRARAHQPFSVPPPAVPYTIRVNGPAGFELIKVIATKEPVEAVSDRFSRSSGPFRTLHRGASGLARDLGSDLERRLSNAYSVAEVVIHVIDR